MASDSSGNFVVVWMSPEDGSGSGVFGQRYAASGAPVGSQFAVNTYTTGNQGFPLVAADAAGNFVVVWMSRDQDGSDYGIFGQRYAGSGTPLGPEFLVNTYTTGSQFRPSVAMGGSGDFVVAWGSERPGGQLDIIGQRYASSGTTIGPEFRVNTDTTDLHFQPSAAADDAGNFVVAWTSDQQDGSGYGIFGQRFASSGAPLGSEFRINSHTTFDQATPSVVTDSAGNFVVVWSSFLQDGSYSGVFGQRYAASGDPLGPEFRVNTYTTLDQAQPSVTADSAGNFVVVWESEDQDGSSYGVFGQRYGQIVPVGLMRFSVE